jgi:hypothetical protein
MTNEIDMHAHNVEELIEEGMKNFPFAVARFNNGEVEDLVFADSELELKPVQARLNAKPGRTTFWGKGN